MLMLTHLIGFGSGDSFPVLTYIGHSEGAGGSSPRSFSSAGTGTAAGNRYTIVVVAFSTSGAWGANPISSPTLDNGDGSGPQAMTLLSTQVLSGGVTEKVVAIYGILNTFGTTATLSFTLTGSTNADALDVYSVTALNSLTPTATLSDNSSPLSQSITISANGVGIFGAVTDNSGATFTWGGTGVTEDSDRGAGTGTVVSAASSIAAGTPTVAATPSAGSRTCMVGVALR